MNSDRVSQIKKDLQINWLSSRALAEKYHTSQRQIRRDLKKIPGVMVQSEGKYKTYHIPLHKRSIPPAGGSGPISGSNSGLHKLIYNRCYSDTVEINERLKAPSGRDTGHNRGHESPLSARAKNCVGNAHLKKQKGVSSGHSPKSEPSHFHDCETVLGAVHELTRMEIDILRFGICHQGLRDTLLAAAQAHGWKMHGDKRNTWIVPITDSRPLTVQLGTDNAFFYCADPDINLVWLADFIRTICMGLEGIEQIVEEIKKPAIKFCELTLIIFDQKIIDIIDRVLEAFYDKNRKLLFKSPNRLTPGFKVYHKQECLRMEFLANQSQKGNLTNIMQALWEAICIPDQIRSRLPEFIESYYPHKKYTENAIALRIEKKIMRIINKSERMPLDPKLDIFYRKKDEFLDKYDVLCHSLPYSEEGYFRPTLNIFMNTFECTERAAGVFLAFVSLYMKKGEKAVEYLEISDYLKSTAGMTLNRQEIKKIREDLIKMKLFMNSSDNTLKLSRSGLDLYHQMKSYYRRLTTGI